MEYSERISIRDFVLDYLIEDGGVIEAEADRVQEALEAGLEGDSAWWNPEAPLAMIDAFIRSPRAARTAAFCHCSSASSTPTPSASTFGFGVLPLRRHFDPYAQCEYTCDLTFWYERVTKETAE